MHNETRRQSWLVAYRASSDLAGKGAFFLATILAARRLPADSFGLFSLATTLGWLAAVGADFGIQLHLARIVAQQPGAARATLLRWLPVRVFTAALSVVTVAAGAALLGLTSGSLAVLALFALAYATSGVVEFLFYYFRALDRSDVESALVVGQRFAFLLLAFVALSWRPSVLGLAFAMVIPAVAALAIALRVALVRGSLVGGGRLRPAAWDPPPVALERFRVARSVRLQADRRRPAKAGHYVHLETALAKEEAGSEEPAGGDRPHDDRASSGPHAWKDVLPIGAGILLSALYFRVDLFLLERWAGLEVVGLYNAVFRLVEALRLFPAAVLAVALPRLFRATSRRTLARLAACLGIGASAVTLLVWPIADRLVVWLYGAAFEPSGRMLQILLLSFPLMAVNYALTHQLVGWYRHRAYAAICALALGGNLLLNLQWIPTAGGVGAAWATFVTEAIVLAGCLAALSAPSAAERRVHERSNIEVVV